LNIYFDSLIPFGMASEPLTLYSWRIKAAQKESATLPQRRTVVLSEARPASSAALCSLRSLGPQIPIGQSLMLLWLLEISIEDLS
jgi:hypothetical protein